MQALGAVTHDQLRAAGQEPLMKVEIFVDPNWIDFNSLAGKKYVEGADVSLGGASMTPNPVEGTWGVSLFDKENIFHPQHPTSIYNDYLETETLVRISIGATYGGVNHYWQRVIGYMDEPKFSSPDYRITLNGGDYMKRLRDTELRSPHNYWGATAPPFNSHDSTGATGAEMYIDVDAMNPADDGTAPYNNVTNWAVTRCIFAPHPDAGVYVGKFTPTSAGAYTRNPNVANVVAGTNYVCMFRAKRVVGTGTAGVYVQQLVGGTLVACPAYATIDSDIWEDYIFYFTGLVNGSLYMTLHALLSGEEYWIDNISIYSFTPYWDRHYALPAASTGPYYVTLDGDPVWQGEGDEDWKYVASIEAGPDPPAHPARIVYFNLNKKVTAGVNNVVISYFTQQIPENVVADLLVIAGLYVNQAAALAAMQFDATLKTIDMVWFKAGTTCLDAIRKICEFCDYRFYFSYDGVPYFKPKPAAGPPIFKFTDPKQIGSFSTYRDKREIYNRIIIKGLKVSDTPGREETMPSDLTGEAADDGVGGSIELYGERTKTITNHLFQTQASMDAMCIALLAEYKDPKWYTDLKADFNPVPLELGDNIEWKEQLDVNLADITKTGIIRDIKIDNYSTTFKCVLTP